MRASADFSKAATIDVQQGCHNRLAEQTPLKCGKFGALAILCPAGCKIAIDCNRLQWIGPDSGNQESGNSCRPWKHLDLLPQLQAICILQLQYKSWGCPSFQCANCALYDNRKSFHWIGVNPLKVELGDHMISISKDALLCTYCTENDFGIQFNRNWVTYFHNK